MRNFLFHQNFLGSQTEEFCSGSRSCSFHVYSLDGMHAVYKFLLKKYKNKQSVWALVTLSNRLVF